MSVCENCKFDRWLRADGTRVCVPKNAYDPKVVKLAPVETCDNKELYEPLEATDRADAANYPLG